MSKSTSERVLKYGLGTRVLHWAHVLAFCALIITGVFLYFPALSFLAQGAVSRFVHRIAAVIFVLVPVFFLLGNWKGSWQSVKEAFTWGKDDLEWVAAAPRYYFLGDERSMPPQEHINSGQKLFFLILLISGLMFVITGIFMWFLKGVVSTGVFQWSVFAHDVFFIVLAAMFMVHLYLSVIHPLMRQHGGSFSAMWDGTITREYAKSHHGKWYERITRQRQKEQRPAGGSSPAKAG